MDRRAPHITEITFEIDGMRCAACARRVHDRLLRQPGVQGALVNLATQTASIQYDAGQVTPVDLRRTIEETGYSVRETTLGLGDRGWFAREERELRLARRKMALSWTLTAPLMVWMMLEMLPRVSLGGPEIMGYGMMLLALPVLAISGGPTLRDAWRTVVRGNVNMDVLIALGSIAAFSTGPLSLFVEVANYSGIAAMIMTFHLTGRYLELRARGRASRAVRGLLGLQPDTATILAEGQERQVPLASIQVGDITMVRPGDRIPTDGLVVEGRSDVDQSMMTGESEPVSRMPGDEVLGGTVNIDGTLKIETTRIGGDTFLARMIQLVREAQATRVPIQQLADRVTSYFVPFVLALSGGTLLTWLLVPETMRRLILEPAARYLPWLEPGQSALTLAVSAAVSVLVIACPCALGLATPTALLVGVGRGAQLGVLIRTGAAVQALSRVDTLVFDKTGTLTHGRPRVENVEAMPGFTSERVLTLAAAVEAASEHPLGRAIVAAAREARLSLPHATEFRSLPGRGARARVEDREILVGSISFLREAGVDLALLTDKAEQHRNEGQTVVGAAREGEVIGLLGLVDAPKAEAAAVINRLHREGYSTVMLTGDDRVTAGRIARMLGIEVVLAEVLPDEKAGAVRKLQSQGRRVAMVGDGVNDAPALAQADVGIALGTGTDIAAESAGVILMGQSLETLDSAIALSRIIFRKIRQNLAWAFVYNVMAIPLAFLGLLHPLIAESAMAASSLSVVANALTLRRAGT